MPGPAPKHPSVRSRRDDAKKGFRSLPAGGRTSPPPAWPLQPEPGRVAVLETTRDRVASLQVELEQAEDGRARGRLRRDLNKAEMLVAKLSLEIEQAVDAERALWDELWTFPQAVMWEETRSHRSVALYVRCQIRGEQGDLKAAVEARQREDRLGLNDLALLRLRAEVERAEEAEARGEKRRRAPDPAPETTNNDDGDPRDFLHVVN